MTMRCPTGMSATAEPACSTTPAASCPKQHRHRAHPAAVDHRQIGMAEAGGLDADQEFGVAGRREFELADGEGPRFGVGPGPTDLFEHGAADPHGDQPAVTGTLLP